MAKNKNLTGPESTTVAEPDIEVNGDIDDVDDADIKKINEILSDNNVTGGTVRLERKGPLDQVFQYIIKIPIEKFDIENIKRVYGGGDYQARTFKANGCFYKPFQFSIDYRFKGAMDDQAIKELATKDKQDGSSLLETFSRLTKSDGGNSRDLMEVMKMMTKQSETNQMLMIKMMSDSNERQMALMMQMFANLNSRPAPAPAQIDFATAFTPILLEMVKNKGSSGTLGEQITNLKLLQETFQPANKPEEEESVLGKILRLVGPVALDAITGRQQQVQPQIAPPPPTADQIRTGARAAGINMTDEQVSKAQSGINLVINQLLKAADRDADPVIYYEMLVDWLQPEQIVELKRNLTASDWCDRLFSNDARVVARINWFEELRQIILHDGVTNDLQQPEPQLPSTQPDQGLPRQESQPG